MNIEVPRYQQAIRRHTESGKMLDISSKKTEVGTLFLSDLGGR